MVVPPTHPSSMADPVKAALRAEIRARRDGYVLTLSAAERAAQERRAADHAWHLIGNAHTIALYIALGSEMSCAPLIVRARAAGRVIVLPHVVARAEPIRFLRWDADVPLEQGWYGLSQPPADAAEIVPDIVITPLLGFDSQLWRIGQGAGFYDRAFSALPLTQKIGLAWAVQHCEEVPRDPWDERLDAIATEQGIIEGTPES